MSFFIYVALLGWIPFAAVLFAIMPSPKAAATAVVGGWLLLPPSGLMIPGLPDYSKTTAASLGVMIGTLLFDANRFISFRPRWFDLPMLVWCFTGTFASLANGLGLYDGLADALGQIMTWGLPYLCGRLYFGNAEGLRIFTVAMVIGGLAYVIPCLLEIRLSPFFRRVVYGMHNWHGTRLGGFRPDVFFNTGLELGLWMSAASLTGWWLWRCGTLKRIGTTSFGPVLLPVLLVTTILCRSTGALALQAAGMMTLWLSTRFRTHLLLVGLLFAGPVYVAVRVTNLWSGQGAVDLADRLVGPARAQSLQYRFECETMLITRALEQPIFGWGGWDRSAAYTDPNLPWRKKVPTDGLWIIYLGTKGYVGLIIFYVALMLPAALFIWRFPGRTWVDPAVAPGSLAAMLLILYMVDCLLNGFANIIYVTLAGGVIALEPKHIPVKRSVKAQGRADGGMTHTIALSAMATMTSAHKDQIMLADRYWSLGRFFKEEGRHNEAVSTWQQALDILTILRDARPNSPELRWLWCDCANNLAWLLANHRDPARRDPARSVAIGQRLVTEFPESEVYWNTLGVASYRAGQFSAAVASLDRAATLGGGTAFDDVFMAMAQARLGNREHAEQLLAQGILRMERDAPGHPELVCSCDEARLILAERPEGSTALH